MPRSHRKCSWNTKSKPSSEFTQGEQTIINFQRFLQDTSTELENWCLNKEWTIILRFLFKYVNLTIGFSEGYKHEKNPRDTAPLKSCTQ